MRSTPLASSCGGRLDQPQEPLVDASVFGQLGMKGGRQTAPLLHEHGMPPHVRRGLRRRDQRA